MTRVLAFTLTFTNPANGKSKLTHNESQVTIVDWQPDRTRQTVRRMGLTFAFTYPGRSCFRPATSSGTT
ncbi:MAG TPA: hypothetical protein VFP66_16135 [Candidatus Limnocylindrales bacterium]|nr:hypothetical protein [Candidatus Limnocylindrales bacterium]